MSTSLPARISRAYSASEVEGGSLTRLNRVWLLLALLAGFAVRVYALGAQSLWNDEGTSVALAQTSLPAIINAAARDIHPPLYYLLLHYWVDFAGISEFALRFLSVFAGVAVIAVTFRIARDWFDENTALLSAVLVAFNPFQVYYAQETRMYIWVTLWGALSVWALVMMFKPPRQDAPPTPRAIRRRTAFLFFYVLVTLAALYTNYYAFTLVILENLAFLAWLVWARRAGMRGLGHSIAFWVGAQAVIVLAYAPWLVFARASLTAWPGISEPMTLIEMTQRILASFVTGTDMPSSFALSVIAPAGMLFLIGLLPARPMYRQTAWGIVTCALWAIVPLLAMYFVSLSRPAYNPKFLLLATPGFLILVARGFAIVVGYIRSMYDASQSNLAASASHQPYASFFVLPPFLRVAQRVLIGIVLLMLLFLVLIPIYSDPRFQRDDYRGIIGYINATATANDAVIVDAQGQIDVVRYYYRGAADLVTLPVGRPIDVAATTIELEQLSKSKRNLYAIYWATEQADPQDRVGRYLAENTYSAGETWHGNIRLAQYGVREFGTDLEAHQAGGNFGDEILLEGFMFSAPPRTVTVLAPIELELRPLKLPPSARYKIFLHLLDRYGRIISQRDTEPLNGTSPTNTWNRDETIIDREAIQIPPGTPAEQYKIVMGFYSAETGARLGNTVPAEGLVLGVVQVAPQKTTFDAIAPSLTRQVRADLGALRLLGYNLQRDEFARGEFIPLALYWESRDSTSNTQLPRMSLLDATGVAIASATVMEHIPQTAFADNGIVRAVEALTIPADTPAGEYSLVVQAGSTRVPLTRIRVK